MTEKFPAFQKSAPPKDMPITRSKVHSAWDLGTRPLDYLAEILNNYSKELTTSLVTQMQELLREVNASRLELAKLKQNEEKLLKTIALSKESQEVIDCQKAQLAETTQVRHSLHDMAQNIAKLHEDIEALIEQDYQINRQLSESVQALGHSLKAHQQHSSTKTDFSKIIEVINKEGHKATQQREEMIACQRKILVEVTGSVPCEKEIAGTLAAILSQLPKFAEQLTIIVEQQNQLASNICETSQREVNFMATLSKLLEKVAETNKSNAELITKQKQLLNEQIRFSQRDFLFFLGMVIFIIICFTIFFLMRG